MNENAIRGNWKQFSGKIKEQWEVLTDDDLTTIAGRRDQLIEKLREREWIARDLAENQAEEWLERSRYEGQSIHARYRIRFCA